MRHLLCSFIVIIVAFTACDQGREMVAPVVQEIVADDTPVVSIAEDTIVYSQYDVNQDGIVDNTDLTLVSAAIGQRQPANPRLDVDGSGTVDGADIILVSNNFGELASDTEQDLGIIETIEPTVVKPEIPEITFENAEDLQPGTYRIIPTTHWETFEAGADFIVSLEWGSVDSSGFPIKGYPADAPKISISIGLSPYPFSEQLDGKRTIEYEPEVDEILVEIVKKLSQREDKGGPRDNRYTVTYVVYEGKLLENLTRPDRKIEYDE